MSAGFFAKACWRDVRGARRDLAIQFRRLLRKSMIVLARECRSYSLSLVPSAGMKRATQSRGTRRLRIPRSAEPTRSKVLLKPARTRQIPPSPDGRAKVSPEPARTRQIPPPPDGRAKSFSRTRQNPPNSASGHSGGRIRDPDIRICFSNVRIGIRVRGLGERWSSQRSSEEPSRSEGPP